MTTVYRVAACHALCQIGLPPMTPAHLDAYFESLGACRRLPRDRPIELIISEWVDGRFHGAHVRSVSAIRAEYAAGHGTAADRKEAA